MYRSLYVFDKTLSFIKIKIEIYNFFWSKIDDCNFWIFFGIFFKKNLLFLMINYIDYYIICKLFIYLKIRVDLIAKIIVYRAMILLYNILYNI